MKKLHQKNEVLFAILWIVAYVVLFSLTDGLSKSTGIPMLYTLPLSIVMAIVLLAFIGKNSLNKYYGLCKVQGSLKSYLYFIPLAIISCPTLMGGMALPEDLLRILPAFLAMALTGLLEELIFRGLLFKAMYKDNKLTAIIVGSLSFGMGHIVNLLGGAPVVDTLFQIVYATALGYLFIVIFMKSGSIVPCIIAHMFINATSVFGLETSPVVEVLIRIGLLTALPVAYALWLQRKKEDSVC